MIIDELADYLETNDIGTVGEDIFIGEVPAKTENSILLVSAVSPPPNASLKVYDQFVDIWAKFRKTDEAYQALENIMDLLHIKYNYSLGEYHIYFSNAQGLIEDNDRDLEGRKILRLAIRFIYRS
jgi:hypothetical protein